MAGTITMKAESLALNYLFKTTPIYLGLAYSSAGLYDNTNDLTTINEVKDANYQRQLVTFGDVYQERFGGSTLSNTNEIIFPTFSANAPTDTYGNKQYLNNLFLTDNTNILVSFVHDVPNLLGQIAGQTIKIPIGALKVSLD